MASNQTGRLVRHLQKGAYVEIEGELRYRDYTPAEVDRSVRVAEIHAHSILALDRSDRQPASSAESKPADEPLDCPRQGDVLRAKLRRAFEHRG